MTDDTTTEEPPLELADPDDYHRSQRLKTIHQRRRKVHKVADEINNETDYDGRVIQKRNLAQAVTSYYTEIEPLLRASEVTLDLPEKFFWRNVTHYADSVGYDYEDEHIASTAETMLVFRRLNQFLADVKPMITEGNNEATSDYSDLL